MAVMQFRKRDASDEGRQHQAARENGHFVISFTGRPIDHISPCVTRIGFDGCICAMGAFVRIGENVLQDAKITPEHTSKVTSLVRECRLEALYECADGIALDGSHPLTERLIDLKDHFVRMDCARIKMFAHPTFHLTNYAFCE